MSKYGIIYLIRNTVNNKIYVGQTISKRGFKGRYKYKGNSSIERVYNYHLKKIKYDDANMKLLRAIKKYGFESFEVTEEFDIAYSREELNKLEDMYIKIYDSIKNGYNQMEGGGNPPTLCGEEHPFATKVVCLNDGKVFPTIKDASIEYEISPHTISSNCSNTKNISGHDKQGNKLVFRYYEDYIKLSKEDIKKILMDVNNMQDTSAKKVICLNTRKIFDSSNQAMQFYGTSKHLYKCCNGVTKSCGKLEDGTKLVFRWYDVYLNMTEDEINEAIEMGQNSKTPKNTNVVKSRQKNVYKKVICIDDNKIFDSIAKASEYYQCSKTSICKVCKGKQKHTHNLHFRYYDEYINEIKETA